MIGRIVTTKVLSLKLISNTSPGLSSAIIFDNLFLLKKSIVFFLHTNRPVQKAGFPTLVRGGSIQTTNKQKSKKKEKDSTYNVNVSTDPTSYSGLDMLRP